MPYSIAGIKARSSATQRLMSCSVTLIPLADSLSLSRDVLKSAPHIQTFQENKEVATTPKVCMSGTDGGIYWEPNRYFLLDSVSLTHPSRSRARNSVTASCRETESL